MTSPLNRYSASFASALLAFALIPQSNAQALSFNGPVLCSSAESDTDGDGWGWEHDDSCRVPTNTTCEDHGQFPWGWNPVTHTSCRLDSNPYEGDCIDSLPLNDGWGWNGATSCRVPVTGEGTCEDRGGYPWGWNPATETSCRLDETGNQQLTTNIQDQQAIWNAYSTGNYIYRYIVLPNGFTGYDGCPVLDLLPTVDITVENGTVSQVVTAYDTPQRQIEPDGYLTFEQIFERMLTQVDDIIETPAGDSHATPLFAAYSGHPISYTVDANIETCPQATIEYRFLLCEVFDSDTTETGNAAQCGLVYQNTGD